MVRCLLSIVLSVCTFALLGQNTFNKAYDFLGGLDIGMDITVLDDGYLLCGTGPISKADFTYVLKLAKLDTAGSILWTKTYGQATVTRAIGNPGTLILDTNGNFYVAGVYADTVEPEDFMVGKFTKEGDSIWVRSFGGAGQEMGSGIYYDTASNRLYAVGSTTSHGMGQMSAVVWVLDTSGNTLDTWYHGGASYDYGSYVTRIGDSLFISGYTNSFGNLGEPCLLKLDTAGNLGERKLYGTKGEDVYAGITYRYGKLAMWAQLDTFHANGRPAVALLDVHGNVLWRRIFKDHGFVYKAEAQRDGTILLAGGTAHGTHIGWLAKLDGSGGLLWSREYSFNDPAISGPHALCNFYDFDVDTATGAILALGSTQRDPNLGDSTHTDFWLVKLDSMGCLVPGCDTLTDVGVEPLGLATLQVTVYPNPANGTVRVILNHGMPNATADFGLYDLAGRKVLAAEHPLNSHGFGEWRMDLSGLPPGMYLYRITDAGDRVRTGKLAIE